MACIISKTLFETDYSKAQLGIVDHVSAAITNYAHNVENYILMYHLLLQQLQLS